MFEIVLEHHKNTDRFSLEYLPRPRWRRLYHRTRRCIWRWM